MLASWVTWLLPDLEEVAESSCAVMFFMMQISTPVAEENSIASQPVVEEEPKEDGEEFADLSAVLEHLGFLEYQSTFEQEKIDVKSFVRH